MDECLVPPLEGGPQGGQPMGSPQPPLYPLLQKEGNPDPGLREPLTLTQKAMAPRSPSGLLAILIGLVGEHQRFYDNWDYFGDSHGPSDVQVIQIADLYAIDHHHVLFQT